MAYQLDKFENRKCERCGVIYTPKYPTQKYCSNKCRMEQTVINNHNLKSGIQAICPVCGKEFYLPKYRIERGKPDTVFTCSFECRGKYYSGQKNSGYSRKIKNCEYCGKPFEVYPHEYETRNFCSKSCSNKSRKEISAAAREVKQQKDQTRIKAKRTAHSPVPVVCKLCGKITMQKASVVKKGQGKYCSKFCYRKDAVNAMKERNEKHSRGNGGKRDDLNGLYVRSSWEANYARYLNWLLEQGEIAKWEYEPETFEFHKITKGNKFYTPDFKITNIDGSIEYHEVKGWMDNNSKVKLNRFAKYYPDKKLVLIDKDVYTSIARTMRPLIPEWEWNSNHSN